MITGAFPSPRLLGRSQSPHAYGLTAREEYYADAKVGPSDYFGERSVELRSLQPRP